MGWETRREGKGREGKGFAWSCVEGVALDSVVGRGRGIATFRGLTVLLYSESKVA